MTASTATMVALVALGGCLGGGPDLSAGDGLGPVLTYVADCSISNWVDACTVLASPNPSPTKAEIDLAVNPTNPLNVVVGSKDLDTRASQCVWAVPQVSKDGGRNWTTVYVGGTMAERWADPTNPLYPWDCITDPIMAFDDDGILYYPLQAYNIGSDGPDCAQQRLLTPVLALLPVGFPAACGSAFILATSLDGGLTYPLERMIPMALGDGGILFHDYPRMLVNPATGTVSTVWNAVGDAGVFPWVVSTRDQGESVDPPTILVLPEAPGEVAFASGFAADADGTVYMSTWIGGRQATLPEGRPVFLATSTDDAQTFGGYTHMFDVVRISCPLPNTQFRCGTSVELAADTSGANSSGRLHAVWDDARLGDADIYAAWSDDGGATWSEPVRVNQDNTTHAQWMPRVTVGDDGTVHVLYMDRAYDPDDRLNDASHAWSEDGGLTWHTQRLTSVSSDGDRGIHQNGFPFIGDYNGIDAVGSHVYLGFPSTATGVAEIAVAHLVKGGDAALPASS